MSEEYKNNSTAAKELPEPSQSTKPVLSGEVKPLKKSGGRKFLELFIKSSVDDVMSMIYVDIIVPKIKDILIDSVDKGIEMLLRGTTSPSKSSASVQERSSIYHQYGNPRGAAPAIPAALRTEPQYKFREYDFNNRGDAEVIMDMMRDILDQNGRVTIAHYYDLINKPVEDTDWNWGWFSLKGIHAEQTYDNRWEIKFPPIKCVK